jgi:DNA repair protein RadC
MKYQRAEPPAMLNGAEAARRFFATCFAAGSGSRERLWVAHVDPDARCLHLQHYEGDAATVDLPIRDIVREAAIHSSAGLVLAHEHPSGDPTPSAADCRATQLLSRAAEAIDVTVLDHLIFAKDRCTSMRQLGFL